MKLFVIIILVQFISCTEFSSTKKAKFINSEKMPKLEVYYKEDIASEKAKQNSFSTIRSKMISSNQVRSTSVSEPLEYNLEQVFQGPTDTWSLDSFTVHPEGMLISTSNYSHGGDHSKIFILKDINSKITVEEVHDGTQETITQAAIVDNVAYFPTEWGSNVLKWENGSIAKGMAQPGRWSITSAVFNNKPLIPYNNVLNGGYMDDEPAIYDVKAQVVWARVSVKSMPNTMYNLNGVLWIAVANKEKNKYVLNTNGGSYVNPGCVAFGEFNNTLYCGDDQGNLYKFNNTAFTNVFHAETKNIKGFANIDGRMFFTGSNPDILYVMNTDGSIHKIAQVNDSGNEPCCSTEVNKYNGTIYWGRSDGSRAFVYKVLPKNEPVPPVPPTPEHPACIATGACKDIVFASPNGKNLYMDLYFPQGINSAKTTVLSIHAGGWAQGSNEDNCMGSPVFQKLYNSGFIIACADYRLTSEGYVSPAQIYDVKAAVRWLRKNASTYYINPDKIGAAGFSSGGHLASLLGTTAEVASLEGNLGNNEVSSKVGAVLDMSGPTHLIEDIPASQVDTRNAFVGGDPNVNSIARETALQASPILYVNGSTVPFYITHGDQDQVVPIAHSLKMKAKLQENNINVTFKVLNGKIHEEPTDEETLTEIVTFFTNMSGTVPPPPPPPPPSQKVTVKDFYGKWGYMETDSVLTQSDLEKLIDQYKLGVLYINLARGISGETSGSLNLRKLKEKGLIIIMWEPGVLSETKYSSWLSSPYIDGLCSDVEPDPNNPSFPEIANRIKAKAASAHAQGKLYLITNDPNPANAIMQDAGIRSAMSQSVDMMIPFNYSTSNADYAQVASDWAGITGKPTGLTTAGNFSYGGTYQVTESQVNFFVNLPQYLQSIGIPHDALFANGHAFTCSQGGACDGNDSQYRAQLKQLYENVKTYYGGGTNGNPCAPTECSYQGNCYANGTKADLNGTCYQCSNGSIVTCGPTPPPSTCSNGGCMYEGKCYPDGTKADLNGTCYQCSKGSIVTCGPTPPPSTCSNGGCMYEGKCYPDGTKADLNGTCYQCSNGSIVTCGTTPPPSTCSNGGCMYEGTCYPSGAQGIVNGQCLKCSSGAIVGC